MMNSERFPHIDPDHQARDDHETLRDERREKRRDGLWEARGADGAAEPKPPAAERLGPELGFERSA